MPFSSRDSANADMLERFPEGTLGLEAWRTLMGTLERLGSEAEPQDYFHALDVLINQTPNELRDETPTCRIFVSRQRKDSAYAERMSYLATQHQFDYWLDIHDPVLIRA